MVELAKLQLGLELERGLQEEMGKREGEDFVGNAESEGRRGDWPGRGGWCKRGQIEVEGEKRESTSRKFV